MYCKNCGKVLNQSEKFCGNCGAKVEKIGDIENPGSKQTSNSYEPSLQPKKKKNIVIIIIAIVGCVLVGFIALFIMIFAGITSGSEKLVCESKEGKITIMYTNKTITGYTAKGFTYDLDGQKKYAELVGTDAYVKEFAIWFKNNTTGSCMLNGKDVLK